MTGSADEVQARKAALEDLIHLRASVDDALKRLRVFDWDAAPNLVTLSPATVIEVLDRYLSGDVTAEEIEKWADGIEVREDIAFPLVFDASRLVHTMTVNNGIGGVVESPLGFCASGDA